MSSVDELSSAIEIRCLRCPQGGGEDQGNKSQSEHYAKANFWENRFKDSDTTFDWYCTYNELGDVFREFCPAPASQKSSCSDAGSDSNGLLVVGCGNSEFSAELCEAGYENVTNIDVSSAAIEKMQSRYAKLGMTWSVMDATKMSFDTNLFKVAVDKGTLDAMMSGGAEGADAAMSMVAQVWRVLAPDGVFILVSHNGKRAPLLREALSNLGDQAKRWRVLELRRCRLSPQATLINVLRSKLKGRPIVEAFKDPEMMKEAAADAKLALKKMAFLDAFRLFKAKKRAMSGKPVEGKEIPENPEPDQDDEDEEEENQESSSGGTSRDPRLQPYCWVYVLQKVVA
eukprot:TRINITY_DN11124_c0_g1_i1.p1 TRINITY_DN11124_c0_g1~~TRINITY_DN11124_c0_g1_i1.p1  ORF type:complete len:342 (-),score=69.62 TRINITY_DN11124_c0_g1_i1:222-1247(-)